MRLLILLSLLSISVWAQNEVFDPFGVKNSCEMATTAEFLAWQSFQGQLGYATESSSTTSIQHGKLKEPSSNWGFGGRLGLDWKLPNHDCWDVAATYTYFEGSMSGSAKAPEGGAVFPLWQYPADATTYVTQAKSDWGCHLNLGDLELGRSCILGKWVSIRPFMGVRGGTIDQTFHITYQGGTAVGAGERDRVELDTDCWAVGLRLGFNSLWAFGKGISLYADGAGSILSGHFTSREKEHLNLADVTKVNLKLSTSTALPIAEIALGLQWDRYFHQDRFHLGVKLGWEMNYFFDQNQSIRFIGSSPGFFTQNQGDLGFMGLTFGIRFDW